MRTSTIRLRLLHLAFVTLLLTCGGRPAAAVPEGGTMGILTRDSEGVIAPYTDVRVEQVAGQWPQETIDATTDIGGLVWVAVLPGTYSVSILDAVGRALPQAPAIVVVPSGAHDIPVPISLPPFCAADISGASGPGIQDGQVDAIDFLLLIAQWGTPCGGSCEADITGATPTVPDGSVDAIDFLLLVAQWGSPGNCIGQ